MRQYQISYMGEEKLNEQLDQIKSECETIPFSDIIFYLTWTNSIQSEIEAATKTIEKVFPDSVYYGNEASGNIAMGDITYGINITCYIFEGKTTKTELVWVEQGTELSSLDDLWDFCKNKKDLCGIELIPSFSYLDVLGIDCSVPGIDPGILIFGGASDNYYNNANYGQGIIAKGHSLARKGMAVMLYYGTDLHFFSSDILGWKGLGKLMEVTSSEGKTIREIDHVPAYSVYEKYLNLTMDDRDTLVFPLISEEDGNEFIRTPKLVQPDKSMLMFASIPKGTKVRISYGDKNTILASLNDKVAEIAEYKPEAIKAYSCAGRRYFWGDSEVGRETMMIQDIAPVCGFYTGGEILRFGNKVRVLNQTLALVCFREGDGKANGVERTYKHEEDKSLLSRLTYFAEKIVEEEKEQRLLAESLKSTLQTQYDKLAEQSVFTSYFLDPYLSAFYVGLDDKSCKQYKRSKAQEEEFSIETDYLEAINRHIDTAVHPDDREELKKLFLPANIKEKLSKQPEFSHTFRDISFGPEERYLLLQVFRGADENHAAFGFKDVTDEWRKEEEQRKAEAEQQEALKKALAMAESANRSKSNFLFNMSHDIRTPMNAITGFTNMAIKHIDDGEKVLDYLGKTQKAGNMLLSLINSVLEVSRIEAGQATVEEQPGDIYLSFENIKSTMQELAATKDIDLTFAFGEITDRYVLADFSRCIRIFVNIITNSIKYTNEGGFVRVTCEQVGQAKDGVGTYRYTFTDNGIGMSEEFQKHIYEQFSREKTSTISGVQGTGLGMSVVKSFVDLMGGEITLKSEKGKGTTFTVLLPFKLQNEKMYTDPESGEVVPEGGEGVKHTDDSSFIGKNVLLVEDNEMNREIAIEILEEEGMVVDSADDGTTAVEKLRERGPGFYDVVLMDIQMPVMNGYEATKAIRAMYPDVHIPIIALSANAFAEDRKKSIDAGMDEHVSKPIDVLKLKETMAKFL